MNAFARQELFTPLGIANIYWYRGRDGVESAASGLRMRGRDLLKVGTLLLNNGTYGGVNIVSPAWCQAMFTPWAQTGDGDFTGYGY